MRRIRTPEAPAAVGAYSQGAIAQGELLFTAGQIGLTPEGELVSGIEAQTYQVMKNLRAVLGAAGCRLVDVVNTKIYLTDADDFALVNRIYGEQFEEGKAPSRECLVVAGIPYKTETDQALVEMSMVAEVPRVTSSAATSRLIGAKQLRIR